MHLPYYRAFKEVDGKGVWLTPSERFRMWLGDRLHNFGIIFTRAADRLWRSVA